MCTLIFISQLARLLIVSGISAALRWDEGKNRDYLINCNPDDVFTLTDDVTIDCWFSITVSAADLEIDVTITISSGSSFSKGALQLIVERATHACAKADASTNYGTFSGDTMSTFRRDKLVTSPKNNTSLCTAPNLISSSAFTVGDYSIGNYNGGVQPISKAT